jgi:beta-xylosidase
MTFNAPQRDIWVADLGDGTYRNPIIHADYSDPDVVRAGDDYFMVSSSFSHIPGLPIMHTRDLVNWRLINHVIDRLDFPGYDKPQHGKGVWAPSISYQAGKFRVFFGMPDEGIFMSTADDPFGRWAPPHCVKEGKGLIDPCPFWDEDGNAYLVHAYAFSRSGIKHKLNLCRMSIDGRQLLDEGLIVFDGAERHPTMEGPKMYKRNGFYYIFAPAGGVGNGWQTILRSVNIFGPYEDKIVLHQGNSPVNGPHQGAWVDTPGGESWFIHFQKADAYGRVVHLQPMDWVDDWPVMGQDTNGDGIGEPVLLWKKPDVSTNGTSSIPVAPATSDSFESDSLGLQWQWQANPQSGWVSLNERPGHLRLYTVPLPDGVSTIYDAPQLLMQKFPCPKFQATTKLSFKPEAKGDLAGLIVFGYRYRYLAMTRTVGLSPMYRLQLMEGVKENDARTETIIAEAVVECADVVLKVAVEGVADCRFGYSLDGVRFIPLGDAFAAKEGHWVGAKVGVFAANAHRVGSRGYTDFEWFEVKELQD